MLLEVGGEAFDGSVGGDANLENHETPGQIVAPSTVGGGRQTIERSDGVAPRGAVVAGGQRLTGRRRKLDGPVALTIVDVELHGTAVPARRHRPMSVLGREHAAGAAADGVACLTVPRE